MQGLGCSRPGLKVNYFRLLAGIARCAGKLNGSASLAVRCAAASPFLSPIFFCSLSVSAAVRAPTSTKYLVSLLLLALANCRPYNA